MFLNCLCFTLCFVFVFSDIESEDLRKKESGYLFTYPRTFLSGRNETVCLITHNTTVPTKVLVDLRIKDKHFLTSNTLEAEHTCFKLYIPEQKFKEPHLASIHLQVQLNGTIYSSHNDDPIFVYPNKNVVFIEPDRAMYKPGDLVKMRILILTPELKPPEEYVIPIVKLLNPAGHIVAVWEDVVTDIGLSQLEHQLSSETSLGRWRIETSGMSKTFLVKRYNLPRFKVQLYYPRTVYSGAANISFSICASYTYGKPVKGNGLFKISCQGLLQDSITKIEEMKDGCAKITLTKDEIHLKGGFMLILTTAVTEQGSNQVETASGKIEITDKAYGLDFSKTNPNFQPGLPYHGKLKIISRVIPLQGEIIEICYNVAIRKPWNIKKNQQCANFTLGEESAIDFYILPVKEHTIHLHLSAKSISQMMRQDEKSSDIISETYVVKRWFSLSTNYLHLEQNSDPYSKCKSPQQFTVYYTTKPFTENETVTFYYMVRSRNEIIKLRKTFHQVKIQNIDYSSEFKNIIGKPDKYTKLVPADKFILKFKLDAKIISNAQLLVYYISNRNNEIIVDSKDILVEKCLLNKVETQWIDPNLYPGEEAMLKINARPNSLCAISAIDKANLFLSDVKPLHISSLLQPFIQERVAKSSYIPHCVNSGKTRVAENMESLFELRRRRKRSYIPAALTKVGDYDSHDVFNEAGISAITNLRLVNKLCQGSRHGARGAIPNLIRTVEYEAPDQDRGISIRTYFPDTWLWELVPVGKNGEVTIPRYLPHTITKWVTNALCVSYADGPGIAPPIELTVSQPFFVDILSPYSIKRKEVLYLQVITFNYFNYSLPISLTLGDTYGIELLNDKMDGRKVTFCVLPNDSSTHTYRVRGTHLGRTNITVLAEIDSSYPGVCGPEVILNKRDVVYKAITVEPEGYPSEVTKSVLLCGNDSINSNNVSWHFDLPNDIVQDSEMYRVLINADLMGPVIQNLERLLTVPTGCGEQIMATLAPNLYILRYLTSSNNVSPGTTQRAIRNIKIGYQRILDYVHKDGSFSAFGYHDHAGSMFLTAFVVRTLQQAKKYIYVDETVINKAVKWISEHQLENGCFSAVSHVFQDMGGTSHENSTAALTSYVIISLLETNLQLPESLKINAQYCIRGNHQPDKYTLALSTYALYLLEWDHEATRSLDRLLELATRDGNLIWWSTPGSASQNVEMTAYALMSLLYKNTTENLALASSVVRWFTTQQNSRGAFSSTQDSAVALDALSRYASLVKNNDINLHVEVSALGKKHNVEVESADMLKTKEIILRNVPRDIKVKAKGQGCVIAQASFTYNVNHFTNSEAFKLAVDVAPVSTIDKCSVATVSPCISYTGPGLHSNMAVLEVSMPSGYEPDRASLYELTSSDDTKLKRFEELQNKVALYFTELNNEPICVPFNINENVVVEDHVEAIVTLYDYYKPEMKVSKTYTMDKCEPTKIAPIPSMNGGVMNKTKTVMNKFSNDSIVANSKEMSMFKTSIDNAELINTNDDLTNTNTDSTNMNIDSTNTNVDSTKNVDLINTNVDLINANTSKIISKRSANQSHDINYGLNEDFVDMDVEMDSPDCMENHVAVMMKPGGAYLNTSFTQTPDKHATTDNPKVIYKRSTGKSRQNPTHGLNDDFVDMDVEMAMPDGIEGNRPMYAMPGEKMKSEN